MWKNAVDWRRPQVTIWRMRIPFWMSFGYKHTIRICNSYCLSTAIVVSETGLSVTLYVQCCFVEHHSDIFKHSALFILYNFDINITYLLHGAESFLRS